MMDVYVGEWFDYIHGIVWCILSAWLLYKLFVKMVTLPSLPSLKYSSIQHTLLPDKSRNTILETGVGNAQLGFVRVIFTFNFLKGTFHLRSEANGMVGSVIMSGVTWLFSPFIAITLHIFLEFGRLSYTVDFKDALNDIDEYMRTSYGFQVKERLAGFIDYYAPDHDRLVA